MNATELAAWVGATTGVCAIIWDIFKWKTSGPKLKFWVHKDMVLMPDPISRKNRYVEFRIRNNGTATTTVTTIGCHFYDSRLKKFRHRPSKSFVISRPNDTQPLPHALAVGEEWIGMLAQDPELNAMIDTGRLWGAVYHSWSDRPVQSRILPSRKSRKEKENEKAD
jgi:gamma-glutamylcysteine synthetase